MRRDPSTPPGRTRREPPRLRRAVVRHIRTLTPRMARVTFSGPDLEGLRVTHPASSIRVLLPAPDVPELVLPSWNGNEFLLPDGTRPSIRTFTPRRLDVEALELDVDIVIHDGGLASHWVGSAEPGDPVAISGPGRGYDIDRAATAFVLAGDDTAIPAICQLLEALPGGIAVQVCLEVSHPDARLELPHHLGATVVWHDLAPGAAPGDALAAAVRATPLTPDTRVWVAGEAAAVQRIRTELFVDRGIPRASATVRGYWKQGRSGDLVQPRGADRG